MANESYVQIVDFPELVKGNTFQEHTINITVSPNMDLTDATYCMQMKESTNGKVVRDFNVVLDTLTNAQNAIVTIPSFNADYKPFTYIYDFTIFFDNGDELTIYKGKFPIIARIGSCQ